MGSDKNGALNLTDYVHVHVADISIRYLFVLEPPSYALIDEIVSVSTSRNIMQISRYALNQQVKSTMVRHTADLTRLNISCSNTTAHLHGSLNKDPEGDFNLTELENILKELVRIPGIHGITADLENWDITPLGGSWEIRPKKISTSFSATKTTVLDIKKRENMAQVINELAPTTKQITDDLQTDDNKPQTT